MKKTSIVLAAALLALAGCASESGSSASGDSSGYGSTPGSSGTSSSGSGTGSTGSGMTSPAGSSATSSGQAGSSATTTGSSTSSASSMGVVQTIDQITRQDATSMGLATGAAAAGGSMGSPTDKVYRVTLRLDDGTTQTILTESMPSYKTGDRVRYANGMAQRE